MLALAAVARTVLADSLGSARSVSRSALDRALAKAPDSVQSRARKAGEDYFYRRPGPPVDAAPMLKALGFGPTETGSVAARPIANYYQLDQLCIVILRDRAGPSQ
jgi:hypothetical protein